MIQLYRPGSSVVHRMPAGHKLVILAVLALGLSSVPLDPLSVAIALLVVFVLYLIAGLPLRVPTAEVRRLRGIILVLTVALAVFLSPAAAWVGVGRMVALLLLASLLTITTRMSELLDVLRRLLRPCRRAGIDPEVVALTISLTITMVPVIAGFAERVREAAQARGVRLGARAVVPLLVLALRHADDVGDALAARGIG